MKLWLLIFLSSLSFSLTANNENVITPNYTRGITFRSHEVNKDERTSLNINPDAPLSLKEGFTIQFDLKLNHAFHTYGYIMRIITDDSESLDITSDMGYRKATLILNNSKELVESSVLYYDSNISTNEWIPVTLIVNKDSVKLSIKDLKTTMKSAPRNLKLKDIYFGASKHELFYTSDVPPMTIRDIAIKDVDGNIIRKWDMAKHAQDVSYDIEGKHRAIASNEIWDIDKHMKWEKEMELKVSTHHSQIAIDSITNRVMVATFDSLYILSLANKTIKTIQHKGGKPYMGASSYLTYDYVQDRLVSYNNNHSELITYNLSAKEWNREPLSSPLFIQHHNRFVDEEERKLILFGGYGNYQYKADLLKIDLDMNEAWTSHDMTSEITPRYLSSLLPIGQGKALLLGGYGSKSGMQQASTFNMYDLIEIDTRNNTSKKLGDIKNVNQHYTFGNSMIRNTADNKLYTLAYRNDVYNSLIQLLELDQNTFEHRFVADSITYNFQDTESFCDLYLYNGSQLYAVVLQKENTQYSITIYSLLFPPLSKTDIWQAAPRNTEYTFIIIICVATLVVLSAGAVYWLQKVRRKAKPQFKSAHEQDDLSSHLPINIQSTKTLTPKPRFSISLLGGFQVFDSQDKDITGQFTPILRQMLLYCLLEYTTCGKGVTSERLEEVFWYDMDKSKAINNRNVNIRKLRLQLIKLGDVSLIKDGMYWQIDLGSDVYCDYTSLIALLNLAEATKIIPKQLVENIIDIASAGVLLPNQDMEWLDKYKSIYSSQLINVLMNASTQEDVANDLHLLVRLADTILTQDNIDEDSIVIKCRSLYRLGQKGLSKRYYDKFCEDYKAILDDETELTYEMIINATI